MWKVPTIGVAGTYDVRCGLRGINRGSRLGGAPRRSYFSLIRADYRGDRRLVGCICFRKRNRSVSVLSINVVSLPSDFW